MNKKAKIENSTEMLRCHSLVQTVTIPDISLERSRFDQKWDKNDLIFSLSTEILKQGTALLKKEQEIFLNTRVLA